MVIKAPRQVVWTGMTLVVSCVVALALQGCNVAGPAYAIVAIQALS
jgi:hypothetical protein